MSKLRKQQKEETGSDGVAGVVRHRISPARASWLFICVPEKLDEAQRLLVEQLCAAHTDLATAYDLTQAFVGHLKNRSGAEALATWLLQAEQGSVPELKSFAKGIHHDEKAVKAAFCSPWSNDYVA